MRLYHTTDVETAAYIAEAGYRDVSYLDGGRQDGVTFGVWFADSPVPFEIDVGGRVLETTVLEIDVPDAIAERFHVADTYPGEEAKPWREYLIPADVANAHRLGHERDTDEA